MTIFKAALMAFILFTFSSTHAQTFNEVSAASGIDLIPETSNLMGGGVAWFDYNNDGYDDLYLTGCKLPDKLYRNNGDGTFEDVTAGAGLEETANRNTVAVVTGDIDNDSDRDILVATWKFVSGVFNSPSLLYQNNGDGTFTDIAGQAGIDDSLFTMACGFIDVNLDGWLDIYMGNYVKTINYLTEDGEVVGFAHECFTDQLFVNNHDGTFTEMAESYGLNNEGCTLALAATDFDMDGDQDLMVANDFGEFIIPDRLYRNNYPEPNFTDIGPATGADIGLYGMGVAVGDFDEDQDFDYYITNLGANALLKNNNGQFENVASELGVDNFEEGELLHTSWGTMFGDWDNDSYLDLFVATGHMPSVDFLANEPWDNNRFFANNNAIDFSNQEMALGVADTNIARGCAQSDYDRDGDLDMAVVNILNEINGGNEHFLLYNNSGGEGHWVEFHLQGTVCNKDAFGSIIKLFADGRTLIREHTGSCGSHASQHGTNVHVGLGEINYIDSVSIQWPGGASQTIINPEINVIHEVVQSGSVGTEVYAQLQVEVFPNPADNYITIKWSGTQLALLHIKLINTHGQVVTKVSKSPNQNGSLFVELPKQLSPGIYQLEISTENYFTTQKLAVR